MKFLRAIYHYLWAVAGALWYRFPSRSLYLVGITGTKGKTTTTELVNAILEEAGYKTALSSTLRFKIANESKPNLKKMSMPGRGFLQKFLRQAQAAGCTHVVLEMTSQGVPQFRHKFIDLDALIFTNLAPEHIDSHGSYENYRAAKLAIAESLAHSSKPRKLLVVNADDKEADKFLAIKGPEKVTFSLAKQPSYTSASQLIGDFNKYNILAAGTFANAIGISDEVIIRAVQKFKGVQGRMEQVLGAPFQIIVDYAHTPDSLEAVYQAFPNQRKIAVLGGTGGGRDKWKRPVMGALAEKYCDQIFFTDEDPYDENPETIVNEVVGGVKDKNKYQIIMNRREAIAAALRAARPNDVVLITGKGTDPYIMRAHGTKEPWSDYKVAQEELTKINA
jgi:UDP-N-acetylmuramoyl-L-alanyl-D-glutamate--2,6-diaminopimelate ligase